MITLSDYDGRLMFAFDPSTDPLRVLRQICWTYVNTERSVCGWSCPAVDGMYCLECHSVAWAAKVEALRRTSQQPVVADQADVEVDHLR